MIILDAFGAHGLKNIWLPDQINNYKTATKYFGLLGLAYIIYGILSHQYVLRSTLSLWLWVIGTVSFSGSILLLTAKASIPPGLIPILGPITPIGGTLIIAGWFVTAYQVYQSTTSEEK